MKGLLRPDVKWLKFTVFIFGMMIHSTGDTVITNLIGITITIQSGTSSPSYLLLAQVLITGSVDLITTDTVPDLTHLHVLDSIVLQQRPHIQPVHVT